LSSPAGRDKVAIIIQGLMGNFVLESTVPAATKQTLSIFITAEMYMKLGACKVLLQNKEELYILPAVFRLICGILSYT
jgi:hypothetical protein